MTEYKTKIIFGGSYEKLESKVNGFLESEPKIEITDIRYIDRPESKSVMITYKVNVL